MAETIRLEEDTLALVTIEADALDVVPASPGHIPFVTFSIGANGSDSAGAIGAPVVDIRLPAGELGQLFRSYARAVDHFEKEMADGLLVERKFV